MNGSGDSGRRSAVSRRRLGWGGSPSQPAQLAAKGWSGPRDVPMTVLRSAMVDLAKRTAAFLSVSEERRRRRARHLQHASASR